MPGALYTLSRALDTIVHELVFINRLKLLLLEWNYETPLLRKIYIIKIFTHFLCVIWQFVIKSIRDIQTQPLKALKIKIKNES